MTADAAHPHNWKNQFTSINEEWGTPRWLFDQLDAEFGFRLDASARRGTALVKARSGEPIYLGPDHVVSGWRDALACGWTEACPPFIKVASGYALDGDPPMAAFDNPPYGRKVGHFVRKAYEESRRGLTVVMLVFARTDTSWWQDYVTKADEVRFVRGRLVFNDPRTGKPARSAKCGNCNHPVSKHSTHSDGTADVTCKGVGKKPCSCSKLEAVEGGLQPATAPSAVVIWRPWSSGPFRPVELRQPAGVGVEVDDE